jgi:hypothetical protein
MTIKNDVNESIFFKNDLEFVMAEAFKVDYASLNARNHIPTDSGGKDWAESIVYNQYENVGASNWIANYGDDLPRCDVKGQQFAIIPKPFGQSYGFSVQELKAARNTNSPKPLEAWKAASTKQAFQQFENNIAWFARGRAKEDAGLYGLLYNTSVTVSSAPNGSWGTATATQMVEDIQFAINTVKTLTLGVENPTRLLMGIGSFTKIQSTQRSEGSDTTVLKFVQDNFPGVTFEGINELDNVNPKPSDVDTPANTNLLVAYDPNPMKLRLMVPLDFTQEPQEKRNLEFLINTHARIAGVFVFKPLSIHIVEDV